MEGYTYFVGAQDGDDDQDGYMTPDEDVAAAAEFIASSTETPADEVALALDADGKEDLLKTLGEAHEAEVAVQVADEAEVGDATTFKAAADETTMAGASAPLLSETDAATLQSLRAALAALRADMLKPDAATEKFLVRRINDLETKKRVRSHPGSLAAFARDKWLSVSVVLRGWWWMGGIPV